MFIRIVLLATITFRYPTTYKDFLFLQSWDRFHDLLSRMSRCLDYYKVTFSANDASTVLEVFEEMSGGMEGKIDEWSDSDGAIETESHKPRKNDHVVYY